MNIIYPMTAEIYYPDVEQNAYGQVKKQWILDRYVKCYFGPPSARAKEDVNSQPNIMVDNILLGRIREDITESSHDRLNSMTNIIITNIKDASGNIIYNESSGPRTGKATLYEIAAFNPVPGAFGKVEYYKIVLRRSENQAVDI